MDTNISRLYWCSLPPEIRSMILQCIIPTYGLITTTTDRGFPKASSLATVCQEWQCFFEKETFRRMALATADLPAFKQAVWGKNTIRLNYLRRVRLHIQLAEYNERLCCISESPANIALNNRIFTYSMTILLDALSFWEGVYGGLSLEIDAHSRSDQRHHWHVLPVHDDYPIRFEEDLERRPDLVAYRKRKWEERRQQGALQTNMAIQYAMGQRLRGTPLELEAWMIHQLHRPGDTPSNLPCVPIVKELLLRPEFVRGIGFISLARLFRNSFVAVESFRFERYLARTMEGEFAFLNGLRMHLMPNLPVSLDRFVLNSIKLWDSCKSLSMAEVVDPMSRFLATSCHRFTEFCPPFEINVNEFLMQLLVDGIRKGSRLQLLSLRTCLINPDESQRDVTRFLSLASWAAKTLPCLRVFELWNSGFGFKYLFRYTQDDYRAKVIWRCGGGDFLLEEETVGGWARVAMERTLAVEVIPFTEGDWEIMGLNYLTILPHMALRRLAFDLIYEARLIAEMVVFLSEVRLIIN